MLEPGFCRQRQQRLQEVLAEQKLDAAVCGVSAHVYYFTGHWTRWTHQSAVVVCREGPSWLTSANEPSDRSAADENVSYTADYLATLRQEQPTVVAEQVVQWLRENRVRRLGFDMCEVNSQLVARFGGECEPIDSQLWQLRRTKDPDELQLMKTAIRCTLAMHRRAKQVVEPGVDELDVFEQLHTAAVTEAGEPLSAPLGNDYACGVLGGPPRQGRKAAAGELYILDLGPAYQGYFADNTRTISVDRRPTDAQHRAWQAITGAMTCVEQMARPGVRCQEIFSTVNEHFKANCGTGMSHHLGHGVGLQPHEFPHLNPHWDDVLKEGEVIAVEPGQYGEHLAGGIRLENQYLVTKNGVENLVECPLDLV